jgi:DNA mismatch endonuclease (patch repair protein)
MMANIKGRNTRPELLVRSEAHRLGLRFRLHEKKLPGRPDIVFPKWKTVVFVHGCFWHRHDCKLAATPKTRPDFWRKKFEENVARDARARLSLESAGWRVVVFWECETRSAEELRRKLVETFPGCKGAEH